MQSEQLKPEELDSHVKNGTFRLSFVGMSNGGKSYRSRTLQNDLGFLWYQVDEEIQKELEFKDMADISTWLGLPNNKNYKEREAKYLELENRFTKESAMKTSGKNLVFDTTGSVIHLEEETLKILKDNCLVVHLDVGEDSLEKMIEKFFEKPKPVAWCGYFKIQSGESEKEALTGSYKKLLYDRLKNYRKLAHINIPAQDVRDKSGQETLEIIKDYL